MLQDPFPNANTHRRNADCDSCDGCIGGPRLFCLDCVIKSAETYDTLDLCSAPQCAGARITDREDLESAHEPSHRVVKVRTSVLTRSHGRVHTAACDAFGRVEEIRRKIAGFTSLSDEGTGPDKQKTSSFESTSTETSAESDEPADDTEGGAEEEGGAPRDARQDGRSLPMCGKCQGRLSFPFWFCIFCKGWSQGRHSSPLRTERTCLCN
jgi:hypothetical protein